MTNLDDSVLELYMEGLLLGEFLMTGMSIQIAIICTGDIHIKIHKRFVNEFSTACYLITRHHAEKMIKLHCRGDKYKLDNGVRPRPVADDLLITLETLTQSLFFFILSPWDHPFILIMLTHFIKGIMMHK